MMSGGTNLPVPGDLGRGSQTPYPYDAYPPLEDRVRENGDSRLG
jgi:hypothetical protein